MSEIERKFRKLQHDNLKGVTQMNCIEKKLLLTIKFHSEINGKRAQANIEHLKEHVSKMLNTDRDISEITISDELEKPVEYMDVSIEIDKEERIEDILKVGFGVPVYTCNLCGGKRYFVREADDRYLIKSTCNCVAGKGFGVGAVEVDRDSVTLWLQVRNLTLDWLRSKVERLK